MIYDRQSPEERERDALRERGYGPTSALAKLRLFDEPEGTGEHVIVARCLCIMVGDDDDKALSMTAGRLFG